MTVKLPDEFKYRMKNLLGVEYDAFLKSYDEKAKKGLRINTLRTSVEDFLKLERIEFQSLKQTKLLPEGFIIEDDTFATGKHPYHAAGVYYLQEPSAMSVAAKLRDYNFNESTYVLDMCAAPGGKTCAVASYMHGRGIIVTNEIVKSRACELAGNVERMGITNAVVTNSSPDRIAQSLGAMFDIVLVDAPCSGEGMFRKNPLAAAEWSVEHVKSCAVRQSSILESAGRCCKAGGLLVYSTCTFATEENECVAEQFAHKEGFEILVSERHYPHSSEGEGHFVCVMRKLGLRRDETGKQVSVKPRYKQCSHSVYTDFAQNTFEKQLNMPTYENESGRLILANAQMIEIAASVPCVSCGVHAGFVKKYFEPSHSIFMADGVICRKVHDFSADSREVGEFLHGETLRSQDYEGEKGYCLMSCDGFPLGFCKAVDGELKNKLPAGLRKP